MRKLIIAILALLLCAHAQELTLTYITQHELDQADNYVQVSLTLALEGKSLRESIGQAREIIGEIRKVAVSYCHKHAVDREAKQACAESVEVSEF